MDSWERTEHQAQRLKPQHNRRRELLESLELLKNLLIPFRTADPEINLLIQEALWLASRADRPTAEISERKPWLFRAVRDGALERIPGATILARKILDLLPNPGSESQDTPAPADPDYPAPGNTKFKLRLFISGDSRASRAAQENLKVIVKVLGDCEYQVIDVLTHPEAAEIERIIATPTLLRDQPQPKRKVIGDLSDLKTVLLILT